MFTRPDLDVMQFYAVNENRIVFTTTHPGSLPSVICSPCGICYGQSGPWISFSCTLCVMPQRWILFPWLSAITVFQTLFSARALCLTAGTVLHLQEGSLFSVTKLTLLVLYMHFRYEICSWISFLIYLMSTFVPRCVTYGKIPQPDINLHCCYF
jgi:hypothetical protein